MVNRFFILLAVSVGLICATTGHAQTQPSAKQLANWLRRFPKADTNKDGILSVAEANAHRNRLQTQGNRTSDRKPSQRVPREFKVDPGWDLDRFPEHAVCYQNADEIKEIFRKNLNGKQSPVVSFEKPTDGAVRIVGTGHSFMAPGYKTFPSICRAAGFQQPLYTHTGGGMTGSARYKWEEENGIFGFDGRAKPKLLCSIANANWDAMMWGPYFNDRPAYYACWIDFCLKYNPDMKFYVSDAWPQLHQLGKNPESEEFFTPEVFDRLGTEKRNAYIELVQTLRRDHCERVFVLPTSDAMVLAAKYQLRGELPGVEGVHRVIGGKERSLWRDQLGHLGPGFERLEGYVFYATIYGKSPELIEEDIKYGDKSDFPSRELDQVFRKIAWQAVSLHPMSGVVEKK